jgi:adenylate cyclase
MKPADDANLALRLRLLAEPATASDAPIRERFAARLREVAARPDRVPIEFDGHKLEARKGGTILASALRGGVRLMHVCGARTLCGTCRVRVIAGGDNLTPMTAKERFSLRYHLSVSPRVRLACQARVEGPIEAESIFPLCGDLPGERREG